MLNLITLLTVGKLQNCHWGIHRTSSCSFVDKPGNSDNVSLDLCRRTSVRMTLRPGTSDIVVIISKCVSPPVSLRLQCAVQCSSMSCISLLICLIRWCHVWVPHHQHLLPSGTLGLHIWGAEIGHECRKMASTPTSPGLPYVCFTVLCIGKRYIYGVDGRRSQRVGLLTYQLD